MERAHIRVTTPGTSTGLYALVLLDCVSGGAIIHATLFTLLHLGDTITYIFLC